MNDRKEKFIDIKKIGAIIQKNFIVLTRDKTRLVPLVLFPVFMILIFGYTSGNIPKHIPAAIVPYDYSILSQQIQKQIQGNQVFSITRTVSSEGEALKLLDSGSVRVIIEIPANFERDINAGVQTAITVIVDESDSAIAQTSRQTVNQIVMQASAQLSAQKVAGFQQSIDKVTRQTSFAQSSEYRLIAANTQRAEAQLVQARKITEGLGMNLIDSLQLPSLRTLSSGQLNISQAFLSEPPGFSSQKAQIHLMQTITGLIASAEAQVQSAGAEAEQGSQEQQLLAQESARNAAESSKVIRAFTQYDTKTLLMPLTYTEKPAYGTGKRTIDFLIPAIIALTIFQGAVFGMGRAVAGEKRDGSLTRVFLTPTSTATIIAGTLSFYVFFEIFRSLFLIVVSMMFFGIHIEGSLLAIGLTIVIYSTVATGIGMIISSVVSTEQQYMALSMLVTLPSMFLAGVFFPLQAMPKVLQIIAGFLPITYAGEALRGVMIKGFSVATIAYPLFILLVFLVFVLTILFIVFKRDIE
ncbi:MAG: ABC transporter permease [Candidatus Woesearchaeota archaeon]